MMKGSTPTSLIIHLKRAMNKTCEGAISFVPGWILLENHTRNDFRYYITGALHSFKLINE